MTSEEEFPLSFGSSVFRKTKLQLPYQLDARADPKELKTLDYVSSRGENVKRLTDD